MQKQMTGKRKEMCITERYMCRRSKNNRVADRITGQCEKYCEGHREYRRVLVQEEKLESRYASGKLACRSTGKLINFMTKEHQTKASYTQIPRSHTREGLQ